METQGTGQAQVAQKLADIIDRYAEGNYDPKHSDFDESYQWATQQIKDLGMTDPTFNEKHSSYDALKTHLKKDELVTERARAEIIELAGIAEGWGVPFSIEMAMAMLVPMGRKTYWRSSHGTCW